MNDKLKGYLKKIVIIVGFIYVLYCFISLLNMFFHDPVQIFCIFMVLLNLIVQFIHYYKTKVKLIEKRVLISISIIVISTVIFNFGFCTFKTYLGNELLDDISAIQFNGYRFDRSDLDNARVKFISENVVMHKGSYDLVIYYDDGSMEYGYAFQNGAHSYVIEIKGDKYYLNGLDF